jgi:hypothetical protein
MNSFESYQKKLKKKVSFFNFFFWMKKLKKSQHFGAGFRVI